MTQNNSLSTEIAVKGMTCNHCLATIKRTVLNIKNVKNVEIDLKSGKTIITGEDIDIKNIKNSIKELGYKVE